MVAEGSTNTGGNQARRKGARASDEDVVSATCLSEVFTLMVCDSEAKLLHGKTRQLFLLRMGGD